MVVDPRVLSLRLSLRDLRLSGQKCPQERLLPKNRLDLVRVANSTNSNAPVLLYKIRCRSHILFYVASTDPDLGLSLVMLVQAGLIHPGVEWDQVRNARLSTVST